jgi:hypothetical protein
MHPDVGASVYEEQIDAGTVVRKLFRAAYIFCNAVTACSAV